MKFEVHKHPSHREYGIRICSGFRVAPVLVIGLGSKVLRISLK